MKDEEFMDGALIFLIGVFSYQILDDILNISLIVGLYFSLEKTVKVIVKYSFISMICGFLIHLMIFIYRIILVIKFGSDMIDVIMMALCVLASLYYLTLFVNQIKVKNEWKLKNLDDQEPSKDTKIQMAFKIAEKMRYLKNKYCSCVECSDTDV